MSDNNWQKKREKMVEKQIRPRGITQNNILQAFREVPRHEFVPAEYRDLAYADRPLPIGEDQTISQPYIVAEMIEAMNIKSSNSVLEVGLGSGYAAAILSRIVDQVFGVEIHQSLVEQAKKKFASLNYENIEIKQGDGTKGWEDKSPFAGILVSAAAPEIPGPLLSQLKEGGNLVIPLGRRHIQNLTKVKKNKEGFQQENMEMVRFVPLVKEKR